MCKIYKAQLCNPLALTSEVNFSEVNNSLVEYEPIINHVYFISWLFLRIFQPTYPDIKTK